MALTIVAAVATTLARKGIVREKEPLGVGLLLRPALLAPLPLLLVLLLILPPAPTPTLLLLLLLLLLMLLLAEVVR